MPHPPGATLHPAAGLRPRPVLVDRRSDVCRLTTLTPAEVTPKIARWLADPSVIEGLNAPSRGMSVDAFRAYVASFDNIHRNLLLIRMSDGDPVGIVLVETDLRHKLASIHMIVGEQERRGQNIAQAATRVALWHFFTEREFRKVTFEPLARNTAAVAACRSAFLRQEGELKAHRIDGKTGERLDQLIFAMTFDEFRDRVRLVPTLAPYEGPGLPENYVAETARALGRDSGSDR